MYNYTAFAGRIAQLNIRYPKINRICTMLDSIRAHRNMGNGKNSARHSFIIGKSGVGKTIMVKGYVEKYPGYTHTAENGDETDIMPVVYVELPDPFTIQELYQTILQKLGAPELPGRPTTGDLKRQVLKCIQNQKVEMLILDEMDYILASRHVKPIEAMDTIKHIGNQTNISLVCVGTPDAGDLRTLNDQYFRRLAPIYLDRFNEVDDEFCSFLEEIEDQIQPPERIGLGDIGTGLPQMLFGMSRGLVGFLTPTIQEAYRLLGVFEPGFDGSTKVNLSVDVLLEAYKNIIGDLTQEDMDRIVIPKKSSKARK